MTQDMTLDGKTALLVEDELFVAEKIRLQLKELGLKEVLTAGTIREAVQHIGNERVDLALLDVNLPDNETTVDLGCALSGDSVPVVFFSGVNMNHLAKMATGHEFIEKPLSVPLLKDAIFRAIERAPQLAPEMPDKKMAGPEARQ